jgi:hypothetical protein
MLWTMDCSMGLEIIARAAKAQPVVAVLCKESRHRLSTCVRYQRDEAQSGRFHQNIGPAVPEDLQGVVENSAALKHLLALFFPAF